MRFRSKIRRVCAVVAFPLLPVLGLAQNLVNIDGVGSTGSGRVVSDLRVSQRGAINTVIQLAGKPLPQMDSFRAGTGIDLTTGSLVTYGINNEVMTSVSLAHLQNTDLGTSISEFIIGLNNDDTEKTLYFGDKADGRYIKWDGSKITINPPILFSDLDGVDIDSPTIGDALVFDGTNWVNSTLPSGDVPSSRNINTVSPLSGGGNLSADRTISISKADNVNNGYLTSQDWGIFKDKVGTTTTISTASPLSGGGDLSANRTISISQAGASTSGYLSSTDWNTFNNKVSTSRSVGTGTGLVGGGNLSSDLTLSIDTDVVPQLDEDNVFTGKNTFDNVDIGGNLDVDGVISGDGSGITNLSISGVVPESREIKTNSPLSGGGDLSADRTLSIAKADGVKDGYLTSQDWSIFKDKVGTSVTITASAPLSGGGDLTANRTISIAKATTSVDGYLSATDWNTFNNKVSTSRSVSAGTGLTGGGNLSADRTISIDTDVVPTLDGDNNWSGTNEFTGMVEVQDIAINENAQVSGNLDVDGVITGDGSGITNISVSGYVPESRTISTNGPLSGGGDLSSNRTLSITKADGSNSGYLTSTDWKIFKDKAGTTTTISVSAPLSGGGDLSANRSISISQANTSTNGYLSSTDWNTFNNKVSSGRTISVTAPLTGGGDLSSNRTIAIPKATSSADGYLSSADWSLFDAKVSSSRTISAGTGLTGGGDLSANRTISIDTTVVPRLGSSNIFTGANIFTGDNHFGGNTTFNDPTIAVGGKINFDTGNPSDEFYLEFDTAYGQYNLVPGRLNLGAGDLYVDYVEAGSFKGGSVDADDIVTNDINIVSAERPQIKFDAVDWSDSAIFEFNGDVGYFFADRAIEAPNFYSSGYITANNFVGGGSGITGLNASNIASGTVPDARLSSNIPRLNQANTFTGSITANAPGIAEHTFQQGGNTRFRVTALGTKTIGVAEFDGTSGAVFGTSAGTNNLPTNVSYVVLNPSLGSLTMVLPSSTAVIGQRYWMDVINRDVTGTNTITFDAGAGQFVHTSVSYAQTYTMSGAKSNQSHRWFYVVKITANVWSVTSGVSDM